MPKDFAAGDDQQAQSMMEFVEKWLGNSATRKILKALTKRCPKDGRRAEIFLEEYATGKKKEVCTSCKLARGIVSKVMDVFISKAGLSKEEVIVNLKDSMWRKGLASVLEGVAEFGPTKPFTSYAPFLVVWNITKQCNLRCKHCYEFAKEKAKDELTPEEALEAVDKMAEAGVAYIAISGGEPLIRPDFFQVVKRIRERGLAFSIATNGTTLTPQNCRKLKELNCLFVQVSVDGADAETHNWFRGKQMFEKTMEGIANAVKEDLHIGISSTVTKHSYKQIPKIIDLAERIGAKTFMHYNFIPVGRGAEIADMDITPQQREEMLTMMARETKKRKMRILSTAPQYSRICMENEAATMAMTHFDSTPPEMKESVKFLAEFIGGCGTGRLYCALEPNGDIKPCVFIPIKLGNIRKDDFLKVWLEAPEFKKIRAREEFKENCGVCEKKNICGGCRARAYAYLGDLQGPDPGCVKNQRVWDHLMERQKIKAK